MKTRNTYLLWAAIALTLSSLTFFGLMRVLRPSLVFDCGVGGGLVFASCIYDRIGILLAHYVVLTILVAIWIGIFTYSLRRYPGLGITVSLLYMLETAFAAFFQYITIAGEYLH